MAIVFLIIIFALIFGSFFTALVYRLYKQESMVKGRSKCPNCQHVLSVTDLVPVLSYVFLGGKCRHCHQKISAYYPLVELGTVVYFLTGYAVYGLTTNYLWYLIIVSVLYLLLVFDWRYGIIPDVISLPAIILAMLLGLWQGQNWLNLLLGGVIGFLFFGVQYFFSRGRWIGDGDLRLGALMGLLLGLHYLWLALMIAYIVGAVVSLLLMAMRDKTLKDQIAFGPFLVMATWVMLLWGQPILTWYFSLVF
ncbi:MAG: prepilin peptidase [Candidatus Buchananbacteria bacterium]